MESASASPSSSSARRGLLAGGGIFVGGSGKLSEADTVSADDCCSSGQELLFLLPLVC